MFAQGGKSEALLDIMGQRLDQEPCPILYVGPSKQFLTEQFEPRVMALLDEAPSLAAKVARGKRMTKTRKVIAGVPLRLAHAGSSTALKSDPAGLAVTDEVDEMLANVKGQGDPIALIDKRGETYADFVHAMVSTPSKGVSDVRKDPKSGLEFWHEDSLEVVESAVWRQFAQGTRFHWAWPCPHCDEYFIPRFRNLRWKKNATPAEARRTVVLECPACGSDIVDEGTTKADMNARGRYVAPGQAITTEGVVIGDPPEGEVASFWVSGLASPFRSWGDRAAEYVLAEQSGDPAARQAVMNGGFGELWAPTGGDVPEWQEVARLKMPYPRGSVPDEAVFLTGGIDVQKNRLVYVVRAWGGRQSSWLIDSGEIWGDTEHEPVWLDLSDLVTSTFDGLRIKRAFVDAGFRPGKPTLVPEHRVYDFARKHSRNVFASKGYDRRETPVSLKRIEVNPRGGRPLFGLDLARLDTDFLKSWVHERIRWPDDKPGAWLLYEDATEDYCRQIVSEGRVKKPGGGFEWVARSRENHFLDCEAMAYGAAYMLGVHRLGDNARPARRRIEDEAKADETEVDAGAPKPPPKPTGLGGLAGRLNGF